MKLLICAVLATIVLPATASAQFRPQPSRLPAPRVDAPDDSARGSWDTRAQDKWDRQLRHCLNDRRQSRRERRRCADQGMPVKGE